MKRMNAPAIKDENVLDATVNAVIIYDEFDVAAKANAMLGRAAHRAGETTHWSVKPWRVDMLRLPPAADAALTEAAEAHLMLLAMRQVQTLPPWLLNWLEQWAICRRVKGAGLAVWDGGNADTPSVRASLELSQFAGRHGLSLIVDDNARVEDKSAMYEADLHQREVALSPTLQRILEQPALKPPPGLGHQ